MSLPVIDTVFGAAVVAPVVAVKACTTVAAVGSQLTSTVIPAVLQVIQAVGTIVALVLHWFPGLLPGVKRNA